VFFSLVTENRLPAFALPLPWQGWDYSVTHEKKKTQWSILPFSRSCFSFATAPFNFQT